VNRPGGVEDLLRELAPQVLGTLVRRYHQFDVCEDAVQEALLTATLQWPMQGTPDNPRGWLVTVAARRVVDQLRSEHARRRREETVASMEPPGTQLVPASDGEGDRDDSLVLLVLCCHPALSPPSQVALTLRAVGGLSTAEIAGAFLVPEATLAQRISRAKQMIRAAGARFELPIDDELDQRLRVVRQVLYLIFNEGYTATAGSSLHRVELAVEAIRMTRQLHQRRPDDGETAGLLALMLLTDARRPARTTPDGSLVPLADQDRTVWRRDLIEEGTALVDRALAAGPLGQYKLQAAIAALHDQAPHPDLTDWPQILELYGLLERVAPNPVHTLNRAVALAEVHGPHPALHLLAGLGDDPRLRGSHRLDAVRAHLYERAGDHQAAVAGYRAAARATTSLPERRYLEHRAHQLERDQ
jgi:RNA polymerase sigma factor (sigma-70 family)